MCLCKKTLLDRYVCLFNNDCLDARLLNKGSCLLAICAKLKSILDTCIDNITCYTKSLLLWHRWHRFVSRYIHVQ